MFGISQYGNLSIIHKPSPSNDSHRNVMKCDLDSDFCPFYEEERKKRGRYKPTLENAKGV
jgi:hypothetical protein